MKRTTVAFGGLAILAVGGYAASGTAIGFGTAVTLAAPGNPYCNAIADVTGDGKADVVFASNRMATVTVLRGNGDGTFGTLFTAPTHSDSFGSRVRTARLNGDNAFDIVVDHQGRSSVDVLLSNGSGGFDLTTYLATSPNTSGEVPCLVDWDGDQDTDILSAGGDGKVRLRLNDATGSFGASQEIALPDAPAGRNWIDLVAADLDADGRTDLALRSVGLLEIYWRQTDGTLATGPKLQFVSGVPGNASKGLVAAEVDGDGAADLAVMVPEQASGVPTGQGLVEVYRHTAARTFASPETYRVRSTGYDLAAADLNGDERPEIVTPSDVLVNTGNGTFGPPLALPVGGSGVAVANLDADPTPDIAVASFTPSGGSMMPVRLTVIPEVTVTSLSPATLYLGGTRDVLVSGTGFEQGATIGFGAGVTANTKTFESSTSIRMNVTVGVGAATGARIFTVTNPSGGIGTIGYTIAADGAAQFLRLSPDHAHVGDVLDVSVTGAGFLPGLVATLGDGVTVNSVLVDSANQFVVNVTVEADAALGDHDLEMLNGSGIKSVAGDVFTVLPERSLDLTVEKGRLRASPRAGRGAFAASGSIGFRAISPDAKFLPATESAEIRFGEPAAPSVVNVPADVGWRIRGERATWHSPRGPGPRVALVLDFKRHTFHLAVARADVADPTTDEVLVEFTLGGETGTSLRQWVSARRGGTLSLK